MDSSISCFTRGKNGICQMLWVLFLGEKEEEGSTEKVVPDLEEYFGNCSLPLCSC